MNASQTWDIVERKMLELRILTNANWKNQEYEMAVLGEKTLRSVELAREYAENARCVMANLAGPELKTTDSGYCNEMSTAATL